MVSGVPLGPLRSLVPLRSPLSLSLWQVGMVSVVYGVRYNQVTIPAALAHVCVSGAWLMWLMSVCPVRRQ